MRRMTSEFAKGQRKMTATHLRLGSKLDQGKSIRKIGFQTLSGATNARGEGRGTLSALPVMHRVDLPAPRTRSHLAEV